MGVTGTRPERQTSNSERALNMICISLKFFHTTARNPSILSYRWANGKHGKRERERKRERKFGKGRQMHISIYNTVKRVTLASIKFGETALGSYWWNLKALCHAIRADCLLMKLRSRTRPRGK